MKKHWELCEYKKPENAAVVQPCHRFWDVPLVGDGRHLSAFEMAVTYSFNGQDREHMFVAHFDFLTKELGLDPTKIAATTFGGGTTYYKTVFPPDEEARKIWTALGIKNITVTEGFQRDSHHGRLVNDNFVSNTVEPFGGPRTELFYDGTEIWTSVLYSTAVEFDSRNNTLHFQTYDYPTFAAGFGLERVLMATNGSASIDNVFTSPHTTNPIVYDHVRGLTRLAHDGAFALTRKNKLTGRSNSGRISVLNSYITSLYR
ncbi:MAG TPA: alanine--tRNA ligase-related protein, partial [Candidatus Nanoarchaeia archaeon]|nr:alanine--tRNA ligase-related protein [Candidatus Nanoarchaeia archaeon]